MKNKVNKKFARDCAIGFLGAQIAKAFAPELESQIPEMAKTAAGAAGLILDDPMLVGALQGLSGDSVKSTTQSFTKGD